MTQTNEWMNWFFEGNAVARLAAAAGLNGLQARKVLELALPKQLAGLQDYGKTENGLRHLQQAAATIPPFGSVEAALDEADGTSELKAAGETLSRVMLGNRQDDIAREVSEQTKADPAGVRRLIDMALPLLIARFSRHEGESAVLLPPLGTAAATLIGKPAAVAAPVTPTRLVTPAPVTQTVTTTTERKGGIPWWVWLLPLLLLGGCLLTRPRPTTTNTATTTTTTTTTEEDGIVVSNPESDSELPAEPFTMSGTAAPDMHVVIEDEGQQVAEATADGEGNWTAEIPAPTPGEHTYSIIGGDNAKSEFKVNVVDTAAEGASTEEESTDTAEETTDTTTDEESTATEETTTEAAGDGTATIAEPAENAEVEASGFSMSGTGKAGETYQLFEDGVSVGTFQVGDDGNWSADVAAPTEGEHTYDVLDTDGNRLASVPVNVVAAAAADTCSEELSINLKDGESVSAPFRLGGRASGDAVVVAAWRGERRVGRKTVPVSSSCTWSYLSQPGGRAGRESEIRYVVTPKGSEDGKQEVTLTVTGSGNNYNEQGEYVGPTN